MTNTTHKQRVLNDTLFYVPVQNGDRLLKCADRKKKNAINKAKKYGLTDYKIETFWGMEYE